MQFRDHPGVQGKRDAYPFDPRLLKIEPSFNVRDLDAPDEREDLDELKESIRANGVRVPLEVRLVDEDVFVTAGHRRHKVVMELIAEGEPIKSVPVIPEPKNTTAEDRVINLVVSNSGKPLKPLQVAEVVRRLEAFGWKHTDIAKRLGWKSTASVTKHLDLIKMPEGIKQEVREGTVSANAADRFLKSLPKGTDPEFARKLMKDAAEEKAKLTGNRRATPKALTKVANKLKPKPEATKQQETRDETVPLGGGDIGQHRADHDHGVTDAVAADKPRPMSAVLSEIDNLVTLPPRPPQVDRELAIPIRPDERFTVVSQPSLQALVSQEIQQVLGLLAKIEVDQCIADREPGEKVLIEIETIARGARLYRQIIGEEAA